MEAKAVVFDCDGVLLDSNALKTNAFAASLSAYPQDRVTAFLDYQRQSFGMSRYRLFDAFFADYLMRPPEESEKEALLENFSTICSVGYPRCALTTDVKKTLELLRKSGLRLFVASGSDQEELRSVFKQLSLDTYFEGIFGSPTSKVDNLRAITLGVGTPAEILFVGDAAADLQASQAIGCPFLYLSPWSADPDGMSALREAQGFIEIQTVAGVLTVLGVTTV